jgi:ABC-type phosphate/phosphonate transport system ATPase subunit
MTTHNQEILSKLNRRVIKLDHGRVVSDGVGLKIDDDDVEEEVVGSSSRSKVGPRRVGSL